MTILISLLDNKVTKKPAIHNSLSLTELLAYCTNPASPHWDHAWQIFAHRYKLLVYKIVKQRCNAWKVERLDKQLSDAVNDIVSKVFIELISNDYQLLKRYQSGDNEDLFIAYLCTISDRTAKHYILRFFKFKFLLIDNDLIQNYIGHIDPDLRWELYEKIVNDLRKSAGIRKKNLERDIHLFMMFTSDELSINMMRQQQFYRCINKQVFFNVIARMRHILKKS